MPELVTLGVFGAAGFGLGLAVGEAEGDALGLADVGRLGRMSSREPRSTVLRSALDTGRPLAPPGRPQMETAASRMMRITAPAVPNGSRRLPRPRWRGGVSAVRC